MTHHERTTLETVPVWIAACAFGALLFASGTVAAAAGDSVGQLEAAGGISGLASWYGGGEQLHPYTASGIRTNPDGLQAAMWGVPFGTRVRVTNRQTGQAVVVRITDRGPARRLVQQGRVIDLSRRAFHQLAPLGRGLIPVVVERMPDPS